MRPPPTWPARQAGVALLLVLWACTLLAILLGGYAALARTEGLQARYQFAETHAHYAAEAGLMLAFYKLQDPRPRHRWNGDGQVYTFRYDDATVKVSAINEGGKVDLNVATPEVLLGLFKAAGVGAPQAQALAKNVVDWRSAPDPASGAAGADSAYRAAGRSYGPRHGPFSSIEELQMVLGMTPAIYRKVAPAVTVWSGSQTPDPTVAPPLALAAIPGMTAQRQHAIQAARLVDANNPSLVLSNGTTHSIESEATLADGTSATVRATIRAQPGQAGAQPYAVLRWQEGKGE
ncbi:MAG: general secretion pathway protein GspK [Pseudomonadota bacterium]|jgi:general secretion pathway protein K|nr:general secretion pathway protein GspK [Xanthomonadaceae bacterium]MDE2246938.1 general secretion pathway protein GspK [Xanthomonadaceae bacterium]MDE3209577.1 general secretion pathway protein GspK [Pseudomonadota bacterium]